MIPFIRKYGYGIKRKSLLVKFSLYFITIISVIILLSYITYYVSIKKYFMDEITTNNEQILKQAVSTYEVFLDSTIKAAMANMEQENTGSVFMNQDGFFNNEIIYDKLNRISQLSDFIYSIYYFQKDPQNIYTSAGFSFDLNDFYDREWLESLDPEKDFSLLPARRLPPLSGSEKDVIPVVINLPYNSANHLCTYVLNLDVNALFSYIIKNTDMKNERNFKIIDRNGMIIISYNDPDALFRNIQEFAWVDRDFMLHSSEGSFQSAAGGQKKLISFYQSSKYDWKYISEINLDLVTQNMYRPIKVMLYISMLLFVLSIAGSISASKKLYQPVKDIVNLIGYKTDRPEENEYEFIGKYLNRYVDENRHLRTELNSNMQVLKKQFLSNLVLKNIYSVDEIMEKLQYFTLPLFDNYTVLAMEIENDEYIHNLSPDNKILLEYAAEDISMGLADKSGAGFFISVETCKYVIVFSQTSGRESTDAGKSVEKLASGISDGIREKLKLTVTIGIGSTVRDAGRLNDSYHEASRALEYKDTLGDGEIILFQELNFSDSVTVKYPEELEEKLIQYIIAGDVPKSQMILESILSVIHHQKHTGKAHLQVFALQLLNTLMKLILEMEIPENEVFIDEGGFSAMCGMLVKVHKETDFMDLFKRIVSTLCECIHEKRTNASNAKVKEIVDYITLNYNRPISVDIIADQVGLNRCYAGRLFRQYNNLSMVDYINQVRINKAVELLNQTDMKVFEIAETVGYNNTHYFIKIFKKLMNMTPGQYKEQIGKSGV